MRFFIFQILLAMIFTTGAIATDVPIDDKASIILPAGPADHLLNFKEPQQSSFSDTRAKETSSKSIIKSKQNKARFSTVRESSI